MVLSLRSAKLLLILQVLLLFIGTLMPGAWRSGLEGSLHVPFGLSSWAHFVLFASMAWVSHSVPMHWSLARVVLTTLALALLTEGLQFFAIDRHPRWLDVSIDMGGVLLGVSLVIVLAKVMPARALSD